ncbi:MAG TPA: hypothetical protein VGS12_06010 [Caulobacteraceae bacterium]|nr:hypothetical protein [Caulobacteraceae bacterium]
MDSSGSPERVNASDFSRRFARYQDAAIEKRLIIVTSHDRVVGGFLSAAELERYDRLKRREAEVLIVGELDEDAVKAIESAEYNSQP